MAVLGAQELKEGLIASRLVEWSGCDTERQALAAKSSRAEHFFAKDRAFA
jgi:hypothetical protein